jgi:hypothetical protein
MKKILFIAIGLFLGISSTVLATNYMEVIQFKVSTTNGSVSVYSFEDNKNICYVSVFNQSNSISCISKITDEIKKFTEIQPEVVTPVKKPAKVFRSI